MRNILKIISLLLIFILVFNSSNILANREDVEEIQEKLANISEEEKQILEELFAQFQEIEEMEREHIRIKDEINNMNIQIGSLEKDIEDQERSYNKNLKLLESVLKSYQRMGAGSFLEIIFDSESISDFIRRMNVVRDLTKNSGELLEDTERARDELVMQKSNLDIFLRDLEDKEKSLAETIKKRQELIREQEDYLDSLKEDRALYEERLDYISMIMKELKGIFAEFTIGFDKVIREGNFPQDAVKESITLKGIKGIIEERTFNEIIRSQKDLPQMKFKFSDNKIRMEVPDKSLIIEGRFIVEEEQILRFEGEGGSFHGMLLEKGTIQNLFEEGDFILDLRPLIGKTLIKSVEIYDGYVELLVSIKLF